MIHIQPTQLASYNSLVNVALTTSANYMTDNTH